LDGAQGLVVIGVAFRMGGGGKPKRKDQGREEQATMHTLRHAWDRLTPR
jgi:hypothetical protein